MKNKQLFSLIVASLNIYVFGSWLYVYNKYPIHLIRTTQFRGFFGDLDLDLINLLVAGLTIISLVFTFKYKQQTLRYALFIVHFATLAFILWMNL